ncbi:MAG TPA: CHAT domain-containing protein [Gemmatimonadales bacterium]|nr:CHAT domain-containing protein [Gemmatimonadales bacterium]
MKAAVNRGLVMVLASAGLVACLDDHLVAPPPPPPPTSGLIISNPVPNAVLSARERVGLAHVGAGVNDVVYVSLAPGTVPTGTRASVQSVNWATAASMERFYQGYGRGADPVSALAGAQRAVLAQPATSHPFYWAGFEVVGGAVEKVWAQ